MIIKGNDMEVLYYPIIEGISTPYTEGEDTGVVYFGKTYSIPRSETGGKQQMGEWELSFRELLELVVKPAGEDMVWIPVLGGTIERYETLNPESGEVLVTYRIPCRMVSRASLG
jgi:hypothetical protein